MEEAIKLLNKAIIEKAARQQRLGRSFDPTPTIVDLTLAMKLRERPDVTNAEMRTYRLTYGELGLLEEQHGFVEGTLPPGTPPPQQSQTSENEHSDARPSQPSNKLEPDTEMGDAPPAYSPPPREQNLAESATLGDERSIESFHTSSENTIQTINPRMIEKDVFMDYDSANNADQDNEDGLNNKTNNNSTDEDGNTDEEIDANNDASVDPERPLPRSCSCSQDVPTDWTTEVDDLDEMDFKNALISLHDQQHFNHVRTKHQQKLAELLGLRELKKRELASVLQIIHTGRDNPWKLKTHTSTYKYFLPDQRPKRVWECTSTTLGIRSNYKRQ